MIHELQIKMERAQYRLLFWAYIADYFRSGNGLPGYSNQLATEFVASVDAFVNNQFPHIWRYWTEGVGMGAQCHDATCTFGTSFRAKALGVRIRYKAAVTDEDGSSWYPTTHIDAFERGMAEWEECAKIATEDGVRWSNPVVIRD